MKKLVKSHVYTLLIRRIRRLREEKNYSERSVAEGLDISQSAYNQKENGIIHFNVEELFDIAVHFKICILELFRDQVSEQEFGSYAASRGYVHGESYLKEAQTLRQHLNKLHTERLETEKIITKLEEDKKFLHQLLSHNTNTTKLINTGKVNLLLKKRYFHRQFCTIPDR